MPIVRGTPYGVTLQQETRLMDQLPILFGGSTQTPGFGALLGLSLPLEKLVPALIFGKYGSTGHLKSGNPADLIRLEHPTPF